MLFGYEVDLVNAPVLSNVHADRTMRPTRALESISLTTVFRVALSLMSGNIKYGCHSAIPDLMAKRNPTRQP